MIFRSYRIKHQFLYAPFELNFPIYHSHSVKGIIYTVLHSIRDVMNEKLSLPLPSEICGGYGFIGVYLIVILLVMIIVIIIVIIIIMDLFCLVVTSNS